MVHTPTDKPLRVLFLSVVPSPYQRDLFAALAARPELLLQVAYLENASPDSPWPKRELASYESVLPGFWVSRGQARFHINWSAPAPERFDVIVLNSIMSATAQRLMRTRLRHKKWVFWGERLKREGGWHDILTAPLAHATAIVSIGNLALADYSRRFPHPSHFNIPYHCDLKQFFSTPRERHDGTVFLFCGQMIERKGIDLLLKAFQELRGNARLLLIGREADLPSRLSELPGGVRARIEYAGFQSPDALATFFARSDVFVLPSRHDGWGVVINQAAGAGLPLICSDAVGAAHDLLDQWVNGLRIPAGDPTALREAMQHFVDIPGLAAAWGLASRIKAQGWTPEAGAERWMQVFQKLHET